MSDSVVSDARGVVQKEFSAEDRVRLVLEGLSRPGSIADLCRREGISKNQYDVWSSAFVEAGTRRLAEEELDQSDQDRDAALKDTELLQKVLGNCPANLLLSGIDDGKILFRSSSTQAKLGKQKRSQNHWVSQEARKVFLKKLKRDGQVNNMFFMARKFDGTEFPALLSSRLSEYKGKPVAISTSTDLTEAYALRAETDQANARLRDAIDALGEGFVLYDQNERFVTANKRYYEILAPYKHLMTAGMPISEITGRAVQDGYVKFVSPPEGGFESILRAVKVGKPSQIELLLADGTQKIATLSRLRDGGLAATILDITDKRKVEARAREMMNDIIQSLDEEISLYDSDLRFIMRNSSRYEMLSNHGDEPEVGQHLGDVMRNLASSGRVLLSEEETPQDWSDRIVELTRTYAQNIEISGADGQLLILSVHKTKLGGYLLIFKDVTEQRRAAKAEREANELLKTIVEACPTTFLVSRIEDGKIIYYPPASRDRFGDIDTTLEFFLDPKDRVTYLNALLPSGSLDDYPVQFRRRDGTTMRGLTSARVTDYQGEDVIVSSTRDISDQLAMQAELERQREIAHQNEKLSALGELLAGVAHELNNPLSIVVGYALMLQNNIEDPKQKRRVERIGQAAERCAKIIKMFLAMARQRPARIEPCSLNEILETALDVSGYGLKAAGVKVKLELDPQLPPVAADSDQMAQVFTNLIVNAEHAIADRGENGILKLISLHDKASDEVVVKVRDNGDGVPKDIQARIFEPFFTTRDVGLGTGVGLAFSHRIISSHDGRLTLHSVPGQGATFIVRMKAARDAGETEAITPVQTDVPTARSVLVVDDEIGVTDLIQDILEENGFLVQTQNDPRQAVETLQGQSFDAILCDMRMPGLDGEAFLEHVKSSSPHNVPRIAFITGDTMSPGVADFLARTAALHLEKPIAPAELIRFVERLCALSKESSN